MVFVKSSLFTEMPVSRQVQTMILTPKNRKFFFMVKILLSLFIVMMCNKHNGIVATQGEHITTYLCMFIIYFPGLKHTITFVSLRICHSSIFQS